ncbi:hypothetical protein QAD02_009768 [Eretmocerus hayati]|uniref:Uncharacterized protein n=1 Tax=Eretmocerus hayati TaxID=131215 RepID=A0ACC2NAC2_9HYME|nr:hypothetical protein QAD02_009768 [Eretmocerus hayati]
MSQKRTRTSSVDLELGEFMKKRKTDRLRRETEAKVEIPQTQVSHSQTFLWKDEVAEQKYLRNELSKFAENKGVLKLFVRADNMEGSEDPGLFTSKNGSGMNLVTLQMHVI